MTSCCSRSRATRSTASSRSCARRWRRALPLDVPLTVDVKVGDDWESMTPLTRADAIAAEADEAPDLEAPLAPDARLGSRRCRSFPKSRPSRATCARASWARRSSVPAARGRARCGRTTRRPSRRPSPAGASRRSAGGPSSLVIELSGDAALTDPSQDDRPAVRRAGGRPGRPLRPPRPRAGGWPGTPVPRHPQVRQGRAVWPGSGHRELVARSAGRRSSRPSGRSRSTPRSPSATFRRRLRRRKGRLKPLLLDQSFLAGVGNIYADEALWRARLHPLRTAGDAAAGRRAPPVRRDPARSSAEAVERRGSLHRRLHGARRRRLHAGAARRLPAHRRAVPALRAADQAHRRRRALDALLLVVPAPPRGRSGGRHGDPADA